MRSERAKIFAPFSPLRGLDAAYREKEKVITPKFELMIDRIEEIDRKLHTVKSGDIVEITYYSDGIYKKKKGRVASILPSKNILTVGIPISFYDIYDIEILNNTKMS